MMNSLGQQTVTTPQYLDIFQEKRAASTLSDIEKLSLLEGQWDVEDLYKYKFPIRFVRWEVEFSY